MELVAVRRLSVPNPIGGYLFGLAAAADNDSQVDVTIARSRGNGFIHWRGAGRIHRICTAVDDVVPDVLEEVDQVCLEPDVGPVAADPDPKARMKGKQSC